MEIKEEKQFNQLEEKRIERINHIYGRALEQHKVLGDIPEERLKFLIGEIIDEIDLFEEIGERDKEKINLSDEEAKNIAAIWVFSGPGNYDKPFKEDKYKNLPWSENMDRKRLNYAVMLAKKIAEANSGEPIKKTSLGKLTEQKQEAKEKIRLYGPTIIYNGKPDDENEKVREVLGREGIIIPEDKVEIEELSSRKQPPEEVDTADQIASFHLPEGLSMEGKEIAIISHAPQLARIMRMINRFRPLPEGVKVKIFPLPTPDFGKEEYAEMEIKGILYYALLSPGKEASEQSYPYSVNEIQEDKDAGKVQGNG